MKDTLSKEATSMVACAKSLYAKGGTAMFTRGLPTTVLRAFPVNAVSLLSYLYTYTQQHYHNTVLRYHSQLLRMER
jgi:Mitochondrial carrier protein